MAYDMPACLDMHKQTNKQTHMPQGTFWNRGLCYKFQQMLRRQRATLTTMCLGEVDLEHASRQTSLQAKPANGRPLALDHCG